MKQRCTRFVLLFLVLGVDGLQPALAESPVEKSTESNSAALEQFEREVRPILVQHCQSCHGEKKQEMGLRLDSAQSVLAGGDNGPVIIPGHPEQSSLIEVIHYRGDIKMPPRGKLTETQIAALDQWVRTGAVWPAGDAPTASHPSPAEAAKDHWAFQPIRSPEVPAVQASGRVATSVDAFILTQLESLGRSLSAPADRRTLIRRATFDLHGLPPTPEEVAEFENDSSPLAFSHVVDRLLGSPRYGERWGRHWLDVARYSDTKGYVRLNENPRFPSSWTYRDYVIRAFNDDLPYDQFIREQLAADVLPIDPANEERHASTLAALGFLTLGQRFLNSTPDIIDDRIDVVSRGLLGLSVSCARCHDHKFDPVPTRDYYGLYGIFANSVEPREPPLILPQSRYPEYAAYLAELKARTEKLEEYLRRQHAMLTQSMRARVGEYLLAGQFDPVQPNFLAVMFLIDASKDLNPVMTQRWARYLEQSRRGHDPVLTPWHELAAWSSQQQQSAAVLEEESPVPEISPEAFSTQVRERIPGWLSAEAGDLRINRVVVHALSQASLNNLEDVSKVYGEILHSAEQRWKVAVQQSPSACSLDDTDWEELRQMIMGQHSPMTLTIDDVEEFMFVDATTQQQLHAQQRQVTDWVGSPEAAPHAMSLEDVPHPVDTRIFIRGNASQPGEIAPRRFLSALVSGEPRPFRQGSGRLELAQAIASADNPLTARVMVNRIWLHHFGAGLVRTPSDFGLRGERPTHPELLDHLASQFIASGWSVKSLHRLIMLSNTYSQQSLMSSVDDGKMDLSSDPGNALWGRVNRRRLDWESLRDSLLFVSGQWDTRAGGPSVDLFQTPYSTRRSVYGLIDRQSLASELRTFDFAPPDASNPQRHQTTVPQQSLFLMNSPFLKQQVRHLAQRLNATIGQSEVQNVAAAYRHLFGRDATDTEMALAVEYLAESGKENTEIEDDGTPKYLSAWEEYLQVLLLSNEFMFID